MEHPDKLVTLGTHNSGWRQTQQQMQQKTKKISNMDPTKKPEVNTDAREGQTFPVFHKILVKAWRKSTQIWQDWSSSTLHIDPIA